MKRLAIVLTALLLSAAVAPAAMGQSDRGPSNVEQSSMEQSGTAYSGTHVSFNTDDDAITDYAVDGEQTLRSVTVQSQSSAESGGLLGADASLSTVTSLDAAGISLDAQSETNATVTAESGATLTAHDNGHGILVVESGDSSQYVLANLSEGANASAESQGDSQVSVTTANGTEGTFIVVGDGNVTVNEQGNVAAHIGDDGHLVFRSYPEGKDDGDEKQEKLIADGMARAEAYVMAEGEQTVVETVSYGQNTTVEAEQTAEGAVNVTVDRASHEGTVVITSVSEEVLNTTEGIDVRVSGEAQAAAKASTYSQLRSAVGSDRSRYLVESAGSASADASANSEVVVAVNHFSERTISMQSAGSMEDGTTSENATADEQTTNSGESSTATNSSGETTDGSSGSIPGFTPITAVVALIGAALIARLR